MPDIYVRGVSEEHKRSLAVLAASLDVSMNTLCMWILEEAAMPYDELRHALQERATELHSQQPTYTIPRPRHPTQPFRQREVYSPRKSQRPIVLPEPE